MVGDAAVKALAPVVFVAVACLSTACELAQLVGLEDADATVTIAFDPDLYDPDRNPIARLTPPGAKKHRRLLAPGPDDRHAEFLGIAAGRIRSRPVRFFFCGATILGDCGIRVGRTRRVGVGFPLGGACAGGSHPHGRTSTVRSRPFLLSDDRLRESDRAH